MASKSFKTVWITLVLDRSEDEMFICYNPLLEDKQVEQPPNEQDEGMKDAEIDDNKNNSDEEDEE